jgi:hypothetical protein
VCDWAWHAAMGPLIESYLPRLPAPAGRPARGPRPDGRPGPHPLAGRTPPGSHPGRAARSDLAGRVRAHAVPVRPAARGPAVAGRARRR